MSNGTRTVLIVEDEPIIAMDMADALSRAGWGIMGPAATLKQAEAAIAKARPNAALLDINLRGQSTLTLAERLHGDNVPVTFLTGLAITKLPPALTGLKVFAKPTILDDIIAHLDQLTS